MRPMRSAESEIVVRVNGEPVTRAELDRMMASLQPQAGQRAGHLAMRTAIERRLILQEAARRNLTVSERELDDAIIGLRRGFGDLQSFGAWMKEQGVEERSLFEAVRDGMLVARTVKALAEQVRVTEEEVERYYETHAGGLRIEEVWLQIIVIPDKAAGEEIQARLAKGEDFYRLAQQQSLGQRAARGGDMGWVNVETLWPPMREAVSTLKPGEAIGPLQREDDEFLIVRLENRRLGRAKTLMEARPEVERHLLAAKQQEALRAWLANQERKSTIEILLDVD